MANYDYGGGCPCGLYRECPPNCSNYTPDKVTAMIMVSVLERKIITLVDEKLKTKISVFELDELVTMMKNHSKSGNMRLGFLQSIEGPEQKILRDFGGKVSDVNPSELKDQIIFT